ncbi:MAG: hypothetical protein OQK73_12190 [Gammaproteobacteria bacterium]|nr:hypothetical protein [Gammaproteobacteria bacterium]
MSKYKLHEVTRVPAPEGAQSKRWYRYVISNDVNEINGCRTGTEKEVRLFCTQCIQQLNHKYHSDSKRQHNFQPAYTHYAYEMNI